MAGPPGPIPVAKRRRIVRVIEPTSGRQPEAAVCHEYPEHSVLRTTYPTLPIDF
jgi:hypothetical protein